jgi:hypothetical protein
MNVLKRIPAVFLLLHLIVSTTISILQLRVMTNTMPRGPLECDGSNGLEEER